MLHADEKANLQQTLERTRAAMGVFHALEGELRLIRKGMAPGPEKQRVEEMARLNRDTLAALERKRAMLEHELSRAPLAPREHHSDTRHPLPVA